MLSFVGLPGTGEVRENSLAGAWVYTFSVTLSPSNASVTGDPIIINSNPLTKAFRINPVSLLQYNVSPCSDPKHLLLILWIGLLFRLLLDDKSFF